MPEIALLLFVLFTILKNAWGYSDYDLYSVFGTKACIEGSILSLQTGAVLTASSAMSKDAEIITKRLSLLNTTLASPSTKVIEKSILTTINELAQYNEVDYRYELIGEEGPPHSKTFTVALTLGKETYQAEGNSLKVAQRNAAEIALQETNYKQPPLQIKTAEDAFPNTPTVQLNNIGAQLGLKVEYELMDKSALEEENSHSQVTEYNEKPKSSYLVRLNHSIYHPDSKRLKVKSGEPESTGQPFVVKVSVGDKSYLGVGLTVQAARHDAALVALEDMKRRAIEEENDCSKEGHEESCRLKKEAIKSPVSLVYEAAQKRKLDLNFEILSETGPSHKKVFVTQCTLADLKVEAEGKSKKESKRLAAEKMLEKIQELPPLVANQQDYSIILKSNKKKTKKNKRLVKNQLDKLKLSASDALSSVWNYVADITVPGDENKMDSPKHQPDSTKKQHKINTLEKNDDSINVKDELLYLTQSLGIQTQFTDLNKMGDNYFTLLSLSMKPSYLCLGEGPTTQKAQEKASFEGINLVYKLGLTVKLKEYTHRSADLVKEEEDAESLRLLSKEESDS